MDIPPRCFPSVLLLQARTNPDEPARPPSVTVFNRDFRRSSRRWQISNRSSLENGPYSLGIFGPPQDRFVAYKIAPRSLESWRENKPWSVNKTSLFPLRTYSAS